MGKITGIQWTRFTWNPLWGCEKVSPGCKYCYAERLIEGRYKQVFRNVRVTKAPTFYLPVDLNKKVLPGAPFTERLVFTCSMSDFFIAQGDAYRPEMWEIIRQTPNLIYQILTKRPERIVDHLPEDWGEGYPNVWLGVSAENQELFDSRVEILSRVPAQVRFVSVEPMLGPVSLLAAGRPGDSIDWIIVGGESGNRTGKYRFRGCELSWIQNLVDECKSVELPIFVKQLGTSLAHSLKLEDSHGGEYDKIPPGVRLRLWPVKYESFRAGIFRNIAEVVASAESEK